MYAVVDIDSLQFKVAEGDVINVPRETGEVGKTLTFDKVLLVADKDNVRVGDPCVKGATVTAEVLRHFKDEKDITFRFRKRKNSKKTTGHRQDMTALKILNLSV